MNKQIIITTIILLSSIILFGVTSLDITIQDYFFDYTSFSWILDSSNSTLKFLLYDGIKKLLIFVAILFIVVFIFFRNKPNIKLYKQGIAIVILSAIFVPGITGGLKKMTNMPCPKNEIQYGGKMERTTVWEKYIQPYASMDRIACWPAGHASGGFALMSLFFLFKTRKNKLIALYGAISLGWAMGLYKMAIGDHFFSHTLITMLIAWLIILIFKKLIPPTG